MSGERRWFVLSHVWLGINDRHTGSYDTNAWRDLGLDLDRRTTTKDDSKSSRVSCKRWVASPSNVLVDGLEGIDNNFGQHVMSVVKSLKSDVEDAANLEMKSGRYTLLLRVDGVVEGDNASAPGALYAAGPFDGTPTFAASETWPVWSSTLADGSDIEKPIRRFPLGYVRDGIWVSGEVGESPEPIWIPIIDGPVDLHASALLTLELRSGRGLIAGALPEGELVRAGEGWAAKAGLCRSGAVFNQVMRTLTQCADLVVGARDLQDEARTCDAISFGIGFDAVPVSPPVRVVPAPPPPPRLPDCPG